MLPNKRIGKQKSQDCFNSNPGFFVCGYPLALLAKFASAYLQAVIVVPQHTACRVCEFANPVQACTACEVSSPRGFGERNPQHRAAAGAKNPCATLPVLRICATRRILLLTLTLRFRVPFYSLASSVNRALFTYFARCPLWSILQKLLVGEASPNPFEHHQR